MAAPAFALLCTFIVLPFFMGIWFSFTNQRLVSPHPAEYVGLQNYRNLFALGILTLEPRRAADGGIIRNQAGAPTYERLRKYTRKNPDYPHLEKMRELVSFERGDERRTYILARDVVFIKALLITIWFVVIVCPLQSAVALGLALLINQKLRGINVFRTIYFMPVVISIIVISMLWRFIYDGENGLLNGMLSLVSFGLWQAHDWLGSPWSAMPSIMLMSIWGTAGLFMVIWLAGLQTIPAALYEAAKIEGATRWQTFRYVTWPGLRNTAILVMVIITMQAFTVFPQVDVMTRGGPLDSTQTLVFQMVQRGFEKQDISGGSAISVFLFLFVLSISIFQRWITRERD